MDFYDVIKTRLSIRQYTQEPVEEDKLARVCRRLDRTKIAPLLSSSGPEQC